MKRILVIALVLMGLSAPQMVRADSAQDHLIRSLVQYASLEQRTLGLDWKVGDSMKYQMALFFGLKGSMVKSVTKDEGNALWMTQDVDMVIQKQKVEVLIEKATGKILKMIVNGKEQAPPENDLEIISTDEKEVTVPAGTFQSMYVLAKSKDSPKIEVWLNPAQTTMDGTLKQSMEAQGNTIVLELVSFTKN